MIDLSKNILYEDENILAINKPAGLVVHPDGRTSEPTVSEWLLKRNPEVKDVGEPLKLSNGEVVERPGIVHRIDRDTSGILLLAKTKEGHACLKEQFQNREIEKIYHAFVYGIVKSDHGTINLPIGRGTGSFNRWSAERGARGEKREAVTHYQVMKRIEEQGATLLEVRPKTGRTHQIRVHLKALHHPIVSDKLYAPKKEGILGFERLALHARVINFRNVAGELVSTEAPYPGDFEKALKSIGL